MKYNDGKYKMNVKYIKQAVNISRGKKKPAIEQAAQFYPKHYCVVCCVVIYGFLDRCCAYCWPQKHFNPSALVESAIKARYVTAQLRIWIIKCPDFRLAFEVYSLLQVKRSATLFTLLFLYVRLLCMHGDIVLYTALKKCSKKAFYNKTRHVYCCSWGELRKIRPEVWQLNSAIPCIGGIIPTFDARGTKTN